MFVGPDEAGAAKVQRIEPASGRREILHDGFGELRPLGDGEAALLTRADGVAFLIETDREERVAEDVDAVFTSSRDRFTAASRQDEIAAFALASDGTNHTLAVLDLETRRLARVTDRLHFEPLSDPFSDADEACGPVDDADRRSRDPRSRANSALSLLRGAG